MNRSKFVLQALVFVFPTSYIVNVPSLCADPRVYRAPGWITCTASPTGVCGCGCRT